MKNWSDQPDEVAEWPVITSFHIEGIKRSVGIEVRIAANYRDGNELRKGFYITHGNLFGSQTLHCEDGDAAFRVIDQIVHSTNTLPDDEFITPPDGCVILKNAVAK